MYVPAPTPVAGPALVDYFMSHVKKPRRSRTTGIFTLARDMLAFKKVLHPHHTRRFGIANLIIPKGARVYAPYGLRLDDQTWFTPRKMRADKALVHSIWSLTGHKEWPEGRSFFDTDFCYVAGNVVQPTLRFCRIGETCASGIHFFLNLADAKTYRF